MAFNLITRVRGAIIKAAVSAVGVGNWINSILLRNGEAWPGSWQSNMTVEPTQNLLTFSPIYASVSRISNDIAILRPMLCERVNDILVERTNNSPYLPVLSKPNRYQTWPQFLASWLVSKLLYGNAYIIKERDARGVVVALYPLDGRGAVPLVSPDGEVYYSITSDLLVGLPDGAMAMPASEVIHDRMNCFFHNLVGVAPMYASAMTGTQGIRIQKNSSQFFENMSRPSGMLTAPGTINSETIERMKKQFEAGFGGSNIGRLFVAGGGLTYAPISVPAEQSQLVEQLKLTVEDVARAFHVPLYKLQAGAQPTLSNISALNQDYYDHCLRSHIDAIEALLTEGLNVGPRYVVKFDLEELLRMDPKTRAEQQQILVGAGIMSPNEARMRENLPPIEGGDQPYMQQQMWQVGQLAERTPPEDIPALPEPSANPDPDDDELDDAESAEEARAFLDEIQKGLNLETI